MCSVAQSCLTLCTPMDCSLPASSAHGLLQARILEWAAMPSSSGGSPQPRDQTWAFCLAGGFLTPEPPGKASEVALLVSQDQTRGDEGDAGS